MEILERRTCLVFHQPSVMNVLTFRNGDIQTIIFEIKTTIYYETSRDDITYTDHCWWKCSSKPVHSIHSYSTTWKKIFVWGLKRVLKFPGIYMEDCMELYYIASNMSGMYSVVFARFGEVSCLAAWVPSAIHSVSFIGSSATECWVEAVDI